MASLPAGIKTETAGDRPQQYGRRAVHNSRLSPGGGLLFEQADPATGFFEPCSTLSRPLAARRGRIARRIPCRSLNRAPIPWKMIDQIFQVLPRDLTCPVFPAKSIYQPIFPRDSGQSTGYAR